MPKKGRCVKKTKQTQLQKRALSDKDRGSMRHKMLTNHNSLAESRPEHGLREERRKSAVQVLFSSSFSVFLSIRLQLLRSRMKFPAAVTSTSSSWQENQNFWKDVLQLRDFSKIIFHVRETHLFNQLLTLLWKKMQWFSTLDLYTGSI